MNIFADFHARVATILQRFAKVGRLPADLDMARFVVEPPREAALGDLAVNAAMVFARESKAGFGNPRQLATEIAFALAEDADVSQAEVAGPGFINIRLEPHVFSGVLRAALSQGRDFGRAPQGRVGAAQKINVEYVSANPTGPMHVGHGRGAVFGDALANLLEFAGHTVTREYYINDAGSQVDVLARSAHLRYREALGETVGEIPDGLYPGDYLISVGKGLAVKYGDSLRDKPESEWLETVRVAAIDAMMDMIRADLAALKIAHEVFFSERSLTRGEGGDKVAAAIEYLREKGLVYVGRLAPPKGKLPDDWEDRDQTLFRSTQFGDDVDRPLLKSDGGYTYFASDIAYHKVKIDGGYDTLIDVWGADHGGYVKRMDAAVKALSAGKVALDVKLCQLVKLMRAGEPVKMSKRSGDFVTLREVVDEVGVDAVRFMMLYRKNDAPLDFDFAKVTEQSKDNPVFYVQYASARSHSVFRQAVEQLGAAELDRAALSRHVRFLRDEGEIGLIRKLAEYPRVIEQAAQALEPHRLAFYLYDLASSFHGQWNRGTENPDLRFVKVNDPELSHARLGLVQAVSDVLTSGLALIGAEAPTEMR